jgi:hypothetical protein
MSRRILPENTTITIWTNMQVKMTSTNIVSNMNSYLWELSREYLDASTPQRRLKLWLKFKKNQISFPKLVSKRYVSQSP